MSAISKNTLLSTRPSPSWNRTPHAGANASSSIDTITSDADNFVSSEVNGPTENPPPDVAALNAAIAECYDSNSCQGVFAEKDLLSAVLASAYSLALVLQAAGNVACKQALEHAYFKDRARQPGVGKPFLIAVQLGAKPKDIPEHKACSMYATVLRCAEKHSIAAAGFENWFRSTTIQGCLDEMRNGSGKRNQKSTVKTAATPLVAGWLPISLPPSLTATFREEMQTLDSDSPDEQVLDALERAITAARSFLSDQEADRGPRARAYHIVGPS